MTSQIRVDEITNRSGLGTVTIYDNGFEFTGVTTFTEDVDITGGLTIGGVLTYEDTTNIDSVGLITARAGIRVTGDSIHVESSEDRLLYLKSTDANAYLTFEDTDSSSGFANRVGTVSDGLYFSTGGGGERLRITSAGNVGINETSPDTYLHVKTGTDSALAKLEQTATNGRVQVQYLSPHGDWIQGIVGGTNTGDYLIYTGQAKNLTFYTSGELRQKIQGDGKVIIGGNANQTANRDLSVVAASGNSNEVQIGLQPTNSSGNYNPEVFISAIADGTYGAHIYFKTRDTSGNRLERLRITSDGKVGIGEGQPDRQLHVKSGANSNDGVLRVESSNDNIMDIGTDGTGHFLNCVNTDPFRIKFAGTERVRINSVGNMGIGGDPLPTTTGYDGATLHLRQSANSGGSSLRMTNGSTGHTTSDGFYMGYWQDSHLYCYNQEAGHIIVGTNGTERFRITSSGTINLSSPSNTVAAGLLNVPNGSRLSSSVTPRGTYASGNGGVVDMARYELISMCITAFPANNNAICAINGAPLYINDTRDTWDRYYSLPNYLLGTLTHDCINNSSFTVTLACTMTVFLARSSGWNTVPLTGWNLIESNTNIGPFGSSTRLYVKTLAAGTHTLDNDSAMYFFSL